MSRTRRRTRRRTRCGRRRRFPWPELGRWATAVAALLALAVLAVPSLAGAAVGTAWRWPLDAHIVVLRFFEPPATRYGPGHRGVDLAAVPGATIRAAGAGMVRFAGPVAGRGVVALGHGVLETTYEPVTPAVEAGQPVRAGDVIGRLAVPTGHCGLASCLHWGLRRGADYLDPLLLLRVAQVRLLPLGFPGGRPAAAADGAASAAPWSAARLGPGERSPADSAGTTSPGSASRSSAVAAVSGDAARTAGSVDSGATGGSSSATGGLTALALPRRPSALPRRPSARTAKVLRAGFAAAFGTALVFVTMRQVRRRRRRAA